MKTPAITQKKKAALFGLLTVLSFAAIFFLAPLGGFTIWITVGATLYFIFMTVYWLVPHTPVNPYARPKYDPKQEELKAYIRRHTRILVTLFVVAAAIVLFLLWIAL